MLFRPQLSLAITLLMMLAACSSHHPLENRVNQSNYQQVSLVDQQTADEPIRFWADEKPQFLFDDKMNSTPLTVEGEQLNILALSGGGANGAFGAGAIMGLYDANQLADYAVITGVSAGALIAPFVYVGQQALPELKATMLEINDRRVLGKKNFLNTLFKDGFSNGQSLLDFIAETYPEPMIALMAQRHQAGKRLLVGTTHFDSGKLMIWNIGAIASSDMANKTALIHQVLAASASIPGVFSPQFIEVQHQQQLLEELHVDGGLATQVFFNPANFDYQQVAKALGLTGNIQLDVIRNGRLQPTYQSIEDHGIALLTRSVSNLTLLQVRGDLYRMQYLSEIADIDMRFTYIDKDFSAEKQTKKMFDSHYMHALFQEGYNKARNGQLWQQVMPN